MIMSKGKIYKINNNINKNINDDNKKSNLIEFIVGIVIYAVVLMIASALFRGIYIENFFYALLSALILSLLNYTIKPLLIYWTLPLTISSLGVLYPIVNMIILWLCSMLMGGSFQVGGILNLFVISIFISILRIILDNLITKKVGK